MFQLLHQAVREPDLSHRTEPCQPDEPTPCSFGCGWFDSSHDLASGLCVQELATPQALAAALPLEVWLELELAAACR